MTDEPSPLRAMGDDDVNALLALNAASEPAVGPMDRSKLMRFRSLSPWLRVADLEGTLAGFCIVLTEQSTAYTSPNYQWFLRRGGPFVYVDRIAIAPAFRGRQLGRAFYDALARWARERDCPRVYAEVNTIPNNGPSHAFHQALGFREIARTTPYGPDAPVAEVAMLEWNLSGL